MADVLGPDVENVTIVGGLVPYLLIPPETLPMNESHSGTLDLDLGLELSVDDPEAYRRIAGKIEKAGFALDDAESAPTQLRWKYPECGPAMVWIDFIPGAAIDGRKPWLPEISLAFRARKKIKLAGKALSGKPVSASLWICDAAAFLILKAIAYRNRRQEKDAHDLYFVLRYYEGDLRAGLARLTKEPGGQVLLEVLRDDFSEHDGPGPVAVAQFLGRRSDDEIQADVVGEARRILDFFHFT